MVILHKIKDVKDQIRKWKEEGFCNLFSLFFFLFLFPSFLIKIEIIFYSFSSSGKLKELFIKFLLFATF